MIIKKYLRILNPIIINLFLISAYSANNRNEDYFHTIYQKYHSQPTSQEVWESALSKRTNQEYTIGDGDTLWDVSRTLFMDGFFWSKIWALNPYILNPHQIKKGQVIKFYPGQGLDAPGLDVASAGMPSGGEGGAEAAGASPVSASSPMGSYSSSKWWSSQGMAPISDYTSGVLIPPPLKSHQAALENFPPSLPNWYFDTDVEVEKAPLEIIPLRLEKIENILNVPFYISEFPQNIKGEVYEIEKNAKTASERDYLFISSDEEIKVGDIYTVIESIGTIRDPEAVGELPMSYEVQGEVKIVGKIENYYKAIVIKSLFPIKVGANIIPGSGPKMNLTDPGEPVSLKGMIIGGENDTTRSLFGPQSIVYINRGSSDGVKMNQRAPISAIHRLRHSESTIFSNSWKIGEVKIVKVEKNYSTAVVMLATEGIMSGDIVGELHSSDITEKFKQLDSNTEFGDGFENDFNKLKEKTKKPLETEESKDESSSELEFEDESLNEESEKDELDVSDEQNDSDLQGDLESADDLDNKEELDKKTQ